MTAAVMAEKTNEAFIVAALCRVCCFGGFVMMEKRRGLAKKKARELNGIEVPACKRGGQISFREGCGLLSAKLG